VFIVIFLLLCGFSRSWSAGFRTGRSVAGAPFFDWHPWFYLFLVPAVGMRLWAEATGWCD
jgi:ABC-2 type transport system permease protein